MPERKRHVCPSCHQGNGLWEAVIVHGWREIDEYLETVPGGDYETDFSIVEADSWPHFEVGCSCGWRGSRSGLPTVGAIEDSLPIVHPDQMELT